MGGSAYAYDGVGNRYQQTISATATHYLLDLQPGLTVVLAQTTGANTDRFLHAVEGIHAQKDASDNWEWMMPDGLGSVRGVVSSGLSILETRLSDPFGNAISSTGSSQTPFDFTGEMSDPNELLFLRARYYRPGIGIFTALDPDEGIMQRSMSLNGYSYVEGNVSNKIDPSGKTVGSSSQVRRASYATRRNRIRSEAFASRSLSAFLSNSCCLSAHAMHSAPCADCYGELGWWGGIVTLLNCLTYCDENMAIAAENQRRDTIKRATVIIFSSSSSPSQPLDTCLTHDAWGREGELSCGISLGTLTDEGIWTHDHYAQNHAWDGNEVPFGAESSLASIKADLKIHFMGVGGVEPCDSANVTQSSTTQPPGTLLFTVPGCRIPAEPIEWSRNIPAFGSNLLNARFAQPLPSHPRDINYSLIEVIQVRYIGGDQNNNNRTIEQAVDITNTVQASSGGGYFLEQTLIGVHQGNPDGGNELLTLLGQQ